MSLLEAVAFAVTIELDSSHLSLLSHPREVFELILQAAANQG
jgi:hypothetical protein